jgi:RNA polymerase sigma-70 factor (ECF subfamily)
VNNFDRLLQRPADTRNEDDVDRELIVRIANHDRDAFHDLYIRYHGKLARFLIRLTRDHANADEIINDTLWIIWQSADSFRGAARVSTWIIGIAYRQALKVFRRAALRERVMRFEIAEGEAIEDDALQATEVHQAIKRALARLPVEQRLVLEFSYYLDRSCEEIAKIMQCSVNTVKSRMTRARRKLRAILADDNGIDRNDDRALRIAS